MICHPMPLAPLLTTFSGRGIRRVQQAGCVEAYAVPQFCRVVACPLGVHSFQYCPLSTHTEHCWPPTPYVRPRSCWHRASWVRSIWSWRSVCGAGGSSCSAQWTAATAPRSRGRAGGACVCAAACLNNVLRRGGAEKLAGLLASAALLPSGLSQRHAVSCICCGVPLSAVLRGMHFMMRCREA